MKKKKRQLEIDPVDGIPIDDENFFGWSADLDKVEDFDDFMFKYLRPIYRLYKTWIPNLWFEVKSFFQRVFNKHHLARVDIWNTAHHMAPRILKHLKAFYEYDKHGHPMYFSEWGYEGYTDKYGGMGMTKEEYEEAKARDEFGGGEMEAWQHAIKEMIFAFEFFMYHDACDKKEEEFYKRWDLKNPHRKTEDNMSWGYAFKSLKDGTHMSCGQGDFERRGSVEAFREEGWELISKHRSYFDAEESKRQSERAQRGMELFGRFYWNLWD